MAREISSLSDSDICNHLDLQGFMAISFAANFSRSPPCVMGFPRFEVCLFTSAEPQSDKSRRLGAEPAEAAFMVPACLGWGGRTRKTERGRDFFLQSGPK
jgi:hypothetical protein